MSPPDPDSPLAGKVVAVTAERRSSDQIDLFTKRGATVIHAPTMHTLDLDGDDALRAVTHDVIAEPPTWTVATTGYGMRLWFDAAEAWGVGDQLVASLAASRVVARGPKAQSACRQRGLDVEWQAPSESMPEVVDWLRAQAGIGGASVAVQLFDPEDHPTTLDLRRFAGDVIEVPIYRWRLPDDLAPVTDLVDRIVDRRVDAVTFTSQPAVRFLFDIAAESGHEAALATAFESGDVVAVCIGPVNAEALVERGVTTGIWPEPFRLVPMVKLATAALTD